MCELTATSHARQNDEYILFPDSQAEGADFKLRSQYDMIGEAANIRRETEIFSHRLL